MHSDKMYHKHVHMLVKVNFKKTTQQAQYEIREKKMRK